MERKNFLLIILFLVSAYGGFCFRGCDSVSVTYDHKALVIDGKRRVLQSGSIHYPRTTPEYYFEGRFDLVRFVKTVQEAGLYVHLRIGPYACAEWNYGGFPMWLHLIPGIQFRTTNGLFMNEMKRFLEKIVNLMKDENLFASQGGPIILAQVENEYGNVEGSYGTAGELYVKWAAETAVSLNTTVPWVMCQQGDAPDPVERRAGFIRQPKWGHLRDLHLAIRHCEDYLVHANPTRVSLGPNLEAHVYYKTSKKCAAFLANYGSTKDATVKFKGKSYFLPAWSVSILPDCKNVVFNTARVTSQKTLGSTFTENPIATISSLESSTWGWFKESVGVSGSGSFVASSLLEQINTTKDQSDFLWYTTSINVDQNITERGKTKEAELTISSLGHAALVYVNKKLIGFGYGNHDVPDFKFSEKIHLNEGTNTLDILSMMIGLQNYGPWFDIQGAGIFSVVLGDHKSSKKDLSSAKWIYQVGLEGEHLGLDKTALANSSLWIHGNSLPINQSLTWYKTMFLAPEGSGPVSINLGSMGKGQAWINGQGIGRYWSAYHSSPTGCSKKCDYRGAYDQFKCIKKCGQPAQVLYHIPRSWLGPDENLLVLHEELGGDPSKISLASRDGEEICAHISQADPPPVGSWKMNQAFESQHPELQLSCQGGWKIGSIRFASFGTPGGECGTLSPGNCHSDVTSILQQVCVGKTQCSIPVTAANLGDPCPGVIKSLAVEAICSA
nr:beta-galactosidase 8-like isoform X2 [Ipomoea batatas]